MVSAAYIITSLITALDILSFISWLIFLSFKDLCETFGMLYCLSESIPQKYISVIFLFSITPKYLKVSTFCIHIFSNLTLLHIIYNSSTIYQEEFWFISSPLLCACIANFCASSLSFFHLSLSL